MINILTLKIGSKYGPEYTNRLFKAIVRNTSVPFRFFSYTDDRQGLLPEVHVIPLKKDSRVVKQWYKIDFHCPKRVPLATGAKCLVLDIDIIVVNNIDEMLEWPIKYGEMGLFRRWWSGTSRQHCELNGGFQLYFLGSTEHLYRTFYRNPGHWQRHYVSIGHAEGPVNGEQNFLNEHLQCRKVWLPDGWYGKYAPNRMNDIERWFRRRLSPEPLFDGEKFHRCFKMIHFANADNLMGNIRESWIEEYWRD